MQDLKDGLKKKVYGLMYQKDIKDIINILKYKLGIEDYIYDVNFSYEEFNGVSFENAIDYDLLNSSLIVNMPLLHSKFAPLYNKEVIPYNWMILFYEIIYAMEDIKLIKYFENEEENPETKIVKLYKQFINEDNFIKDHKFLYLYKSSKTTNADNLIDPIERIKSVNAYFETRNIFKELNIDPTSMKCFKILFEEDLLNGYNLDDQNQYPLRNFFFQNSYLEGKLFMNKFDWYNKEPMMAVSNASNEVNDVKDRLALGYPIDSVEYLLVRKNRI